MNYYGRYLLDTTNVPISIWPSVLEKAGRTESYWDGATTGDASVINFVLHLENLGIFSIFLFISKTDFKMVGLMP